MDEPAEHPGRPPAWPPARREVPVEHFHPPSSSLVGGSPDLPPPPGVGPWWSRLVRTPRGAVGLALTAAALLLWPFAGWSAIPWLIGIAVLVALRLLRLDGLLRGWTLPVGGLTVVVGLMVETTPWAWALAAGIGVLLAGLAALPRWKVAAVGVVLCLVAGAGFGLSRYRTAQELAVAAARANRESQGQQGASRPQGVLPVLLNRVAQNVPGPVCDNLLSAAARAALVAATGQADCPAAVAALSGRVVDRLHYAEGEAHSTVVPDGLEVDACSLTWPSGTAAGPQLGRLVVAHKPGGSTYVVTGFTGC